jgi:Tfp pilus assembly protein PilX
VFDRDDKDQALARILTSEALQMKKPATSRQNGIALVSALLILVLLSAIAVGLVLTANTESAVNANYRQERALDFAARAGIEEVRDRMASASAHTLVSPTCTPASACLAAAPVVPSTTNNGILYVLGGKTPASVTPWTLNTVYTDDELCHDGYGLVTSQSSDVHCSSVPTGSAWYASTNSTAPWAGTGAALAFQWVRVSWKLNGSIQGYPVNVVSCSQTGVGAGCGRAVCYNGTHEILLETGKTACSENTPTATPVYLLTSLALNTTTGARRMVQAEVALPPPTVTSLAGFFATSTACGAFVMQGGATTDGFSSSGGGYPSTRSTTAGGIGSNGSVSLGGSPTQVGGNIYVPNATIGACPAGVQESGGAGLLAGNNVIAQPAVSVPTPPALNPLPPTTNLNNPRSLVPGTFGNINLTGQTALTLSPGIYKINSISMTGQSTISISPAGAVVINVAGTGQATPVDLEGGGLMNTTGVAGNFQVNYAGTGNMKVAGGSGSYAVINAPNASLQFTGGSNFYGSAVAATVTDTGGTSLHFDTTLLSNTTTPAANLAEISLREVAY